MPPNVTDCDKKKASGVSEYVEHVHKGVEKIGTDPNFKREIVWFNTIGFVVLHLAALAGIPFAFFCKFYTIMWSASIALISGEGVTLGAHRMYSHRAFKATRITKAVLLVLQTIAGQNCMYIWVRDHRQHHKFSDTDADPHNANRGFFFSHIGWLMSRKHPEVIRKGKTIDMSDLEADKLVMFQKKYYKPLYAFFALAIPILIPVYFWNENLINSFFISYMTRYIIVLNITWLVNSAAHFFGTKPYDRTMRPVESALIAIVTAGEGWHNYHHTFPWDYRAAELGMKYNITTFFINLLAKFGCVYDLKTAPYSIVEHRVRRTGDGSHQHIHPRQVTAVTDAESEVTLDETEREVQNEQINDNVNSLNKYEEKKDSNVIEGEAVVEDINVQFANNVGHFVRSESCMDIFLNGIKAQFEDDISDDAEPEVDAEKNSFDGNANNLLKSDSSNLKSRTSSLLKDSIVNEFGCNIIRQRPI